VLRTLFWPKRDLVGALLAAGELDAARDEVRAHPFDPTAAANVARILHRRLLRRAVSAGLLVFVALIAVVVRARMARRSLAAVAHAPSHD
jgi:hypothetical protein